MNAEERLEKVLDVLADIPPLRENAPPFEWAEQMRKWAKDVREAAKVPEPGAEGEAWKKCRKCHTNNLSWREICIICGYAFVANARTEPNVPWVPDYDTRHAAITKAIRCGRIGTPAISESIAHGILSIWSELKAIMEPTPVYVGVDVAAPGEEKTLYRCVCGFLSTDPYEFTAHAQSDCGK